MPTCRHYRTRNPAGGDTFALGDSVGPRGEGHGDTCAISPAGTGVYRLGHFGTAAKKLKQFDLKH